MSHLTQSARNQDCQIRLHKICNGNPETTVLAHLPGGGVGGKVSDIHGAYACSACHDEVDGRAMNFEEGRPRLMCYFYEGVIRTQTLMLEAGLINV